MKKGKVDQYANLYTAENSLQKSLSRNMHTTVRYSL